MAHCRTRGYENANKAHRKEKGRILEALKMLGGSSGNKRLRKELGWNEELYKRVKDSCGEKIEFGPGNGGTVLLKETRRVSRSTPAKGNDCAFIAMPIDKNDPNLEDVLEIEMLPNGAGLKQAELMRTSRTRELPTVFLKQLRPRNS